MAYFDCIVGGSGGGYTLTVNTDSTFSGATVTATDGTTTLTTTFTSSSPYTAEFSIPNGGTWTIASGNISDTVNVPSTLELHDIPTGSTVTPTDDIQTWLHCANIWNKSYTTISQVLNDGTTVTALIASTNAVDYMARSTSWVSSVCANSSAMTKIGANNYCADKLLANSTWFDAICSSAYIESVLNVKVPTMTSNTAPSGVASAASVYNGSDTYQAWRSFNNVDKQSCLVSGTSGYIQYNFTQAVNIKCVKLKEHNNTTQVGILSLPKNITFKVSSDGSNWTDVGTGLISSAVKNQTYTFKLQSNTQKKTYFRLQATTNCGEGAYTQFGSILQFYGRA